MKKIQISPSILSADFSRLGEDIKRLEESGADMIHVDVMDGHFVPNLTIGPPVIKSLRKHTKLPFDVHLMINPVLPFIEEFINAGSDIISFHPEADKNSNKIIEIVKNTNCKVGIAIHPHKEIEEIKQFLGIVDQVIVMTVVPGFGGQNFLEDQVKKINKLNEIKKKNNFIFEIEIDGGINNKTSQLCTKNGANILVAGSYIFKSKNSDYKQLINSLR